MRSYIALIVLGLTLGEISACSVAHPVVRLTEDWPAAPRDYADVVAEWTRKAELRVDYQEACELTATLKSPEWRAAHAAQDADHRGLTGEARAQHLQQARADAVGPYELEIMLTTWDRRENDIDRGKKSVWRVVLIDEAGHEIEALEIIKDRRPTFVVRAEFPALGQFATPYIARFPRSVAILGPNAKQVRLRMSSPRGGLEVTWRAQ
ncbi:MAG: hypothetical protein H7138_20675 [Myxococcales bacterium]|nr:hypothetical protein [Myxococcales bacterium]